MNMRDLVLTVIACFSLATFGLAAQVKVALNPTNDQSNISGEVALTEEDNGLTVEATVANVSPGKHGFHFHENGSCEEGGKAAGGHFNPDKVEHGYLPKDGHGHAHAGDMGNIEVGADGSGTLKVFLPGVSLEQGAYAVAGKAIILHAKEDDFGQPTGNAGDRIGCGVIEVAPQAEQKTGY